MSKFVIKLSIEVDTDAIVEKMKHHGIVKADGSINGVDAYDYLKGYINRTVAAKMDTADLFKEVIEDLDKKLNTQDLFKHV